MLFQVLVESTNRIDREFNRTSETYQTFNEESLRKGTGGSVRCSTVGKLIDV